MNCVYCGDKFIETFSFHRMFIKGKETACHQCLDRFEKISGTVCRVCGCVVVNQNLCKNCSNFIKDNSVHPITSNRSVFRYTDEMKNWLNRYKFYCHVTLATMFITDLQEYYESYFKQVKIIVPIPLSEERLKERGFNQVEVLGEHAGFNLLNCLKRVPYRTAKQIKSNRKTASKTNFFLLRREKI